MNTPIVLAFSGGVDTSYCVLALREQGFTVHTAFVDTGGVSAAQKDWIRARALQLGAEQHHELQAGQALWDEFVIPLLWSGARMLEQYPMLCSDRYMIVASCLQLVDQLGADQRGRKHFAHGCTGMGNDQLRFDQSVRSLGDYQIHAPIRDLQRQTSKVRQHELEWLQQAGIEVPDNASRYSINENLLGVTLSGAEIDDFAAPQDDTRVWCAARADWPAGSSSWLLEFVGGVPTALNGEALPGPELLARLNQELGAWGIGRHVYTGDVSIGLKGRIVFECPGIDGLMVAQRALQEAVNTRFQNQFRHIIAARWAELVYNGFFYEPQMADLHAYLHSSNRFVSGTVTLASNGGDIHAVAIDSPWILRDAESVYAQSASWTPEQAEGFVKLIGQSSTLATSIRRKKTGE